MWEYPCACVEAEFVVVVCVRAKENGCKMLSAI